MFKRILTASALLLSLSLNTHAVESGAPAPEFSLPVLQNAADKQLSLSSYAGKVVYVDFWASWCGPCRQSLPILNDIRTKLSSKGFEVIAVNIDEETKDAQDFLAKFPVSYPIVLDPASKTPEMYKIKGMPTAYLIDKAGIVSYVHEGFEKEDAAEIEAKITELLAK